MGDLTTIPIMHLYLVHIIIIRYTHIMQHHDLQTTWGGEANDRDH